LRSTVYASPRRALGIVCLALLVQTLTACSSGSDNNGEDIDPGAGISNGVVVTPESGSTSAAGVTILAGSTLALSASVINATDNSGVSWRVEGAGSLTNATSTSVTYVAPVTVTGALTPLIVATSNADSTQIGAVSVRVLGTPSITPEPLFPAYVANPYAAFIPVQGGITPFTWTISSGTLPPGLALSGNTTTYYETITGAPTAAGTYNFQILVTDTTGRTASTDLTLVVHPATSCILSGQYAMLVSGISSGQMATRAASFTVTDGSISGVSDRKSAGATTAAETFTGNCTTRYGNNGDLRLTSSSEALIFNFAINGGLNQGRLMLSSGGDSATASGQFERQDPAAFNLAALAGDFAFGTLGALPGEGRIGVIGQLSVDAGGTVTTGRIDSNAAGALDAAALSGSMSTPDARGRGVLNLGGGGQNFSFAYYVIDANRVWLISADPAAGAPRLTGYMTRRAASFDNTALATPGILTLWGNDPIRVPGTTLTLARLSNANSGAGTVDLQLDNSGYASNIFNRSFPGAQYGVDAGGRATLSFGSAGSTRQFTLYLDGSANGYAIEKGSAVGNAGLLEAQMPGPYEPAMGGLLVLGTQFPQSSSPVALVPISYFVDGTIVSNFLSGSFSVEINSGHGLGVMSLSPLSRTASLYRIQPGKTVILWFGTPSSSPAIEWLIN